jgi:hypothetical protein
MSMSTTIMILLSLLLIISIAAIAYVYTLSAVGAGHAAKAPEGGARSYSQQFCLNAAQNYTAMLFALKSGAGCFRTDISPNQNEIARVANITKMGGTYLGILDYQTVGAQPSPTGCRSGCSWTLNTWNQSVSNAISDYPNVNEWEIWNEPYIQEFESGYENGSALNYFEMIKSAYYIIKSKEPNATIVCFGGAQIYPYSTAIAEYNFYKQVWGYGAASFCSAISIHIYSVPYYNLSQDVQPGVTLAQWYNQTINLYENLTHKPIWVTETGIPSNNFTEGVSFSEQRQASFIYQDLSLLSSYQFIQRIYVFDLAGSLQSGGPDYGLLNSTTLKPKPSWYVFMGFLDNSTSTNG